MINFDKTQIKKYSCSKIQGTGFLAFRDLEYFSKYICRSNLSHVLDLGCGAGRSTKYLSQFCADIEGCDISEEAIISAKKSNDFNFFLASQETDIYGDGNYNTIFSILMFFHLTDEHEIEYVLKKAHDSLSKDGDLIIVSGNRSLYERNYSSIEKIDPPPENDASLVKIRLKNIDCVVEDIYWTKEKIISLAKKNNFELIALHQPTGSYFDEQTYEDEYFYAPYYYLCLRKI